MLAAVKRYKELGLASALSRPYDYPAACHELSVLLRIAYPKLPKSMQNIVLNDVFVAFQHLAEVQTSYGISSANRLLQAAEAVLPKLKKSYIVSEYKHAMIAQKRNCKAHQDGGSVQLPHDILFHIFSFLDMRSLVAASRVCWAWNSAAKDNKLWKLQYCLLFGKYDIYCRSKEQRLFQAKGETAVHQSTEDMYTTTAIDWRELFKRKYIGNPSWRSTINRAICGHCKSIIWLTDMTSVGPHHCLKLETQSCQIKAISSYRVAKYVLGQTELSVSSSDSDTSDSEGSSRLPKFWAFPELRELAKFTVMI